MKRHSFWLPERQTGRLEKLAKKTDIKAAEHVRRAIDEYLARNL